MWSYPWESQRDPAQIYNRFSTITEVHNIAWPAYEAPEYDAAHFLQGIAGDTRTLSSVDAVVPGARRGGHRPASVQAWSSMAAIARSMAAVRVITNENCAPCRTHAATTARLPYAESPRTRIWPLAPTARAVPIAWATMRPTPCPSWPARPAATARRSPEPNPGC